MDSISLNKRKIFNDPVYGFITIPNELIFDIIAHPFFQRLRRIKQLGLTELVYPGAIHTRFQHSIGTMHLTSLAIETLRIKGMFISEEEAEGAMVAILLHDIGHGPFSHSLEHAIVQGVSHEDLSSLFMEELNRQFAGKLNTAMAIFNNTYPKKFLHQLISSQLDMDRLDYLKRDSFYTGVTEGMINSDRIIKMLQVENDSLVVEHKGIYSIENFIISRRLMYWQVYLHKTVLSAEKLLIRILKRAKFLVQQGDKLQGSLALVHFLAHNFSLDHFKANATLLAQFAELDDYDIISAIKSWQHHSDKVLSFLCTNLINRHLYKIELQNIPFDEWYVEDIKQKAILHYQLTPEEVPYYVFTGKTASSIYNSNLDKINILLKNKMVMDIAEASDQLDVRVLSKTITKNFLCYPKGMGI